MTREFLKNLGLEDATIDKILDENMRDIGKEKGNTATAQNELSTAQGKLKTALEDLDVLKKSNGDVAVVQKQLEDLQKKYDDDTAALNAKLAERDYTDAISRAIAGNGLKFSSKSAQRAFEAAIRDKKLELKDGELTGLDDFIKDQKEADPDAFAPDKPTPRIVAGMGGGGHSAPPESVPANVAQAKEMGTVRAASAKASADVMKNYL